MTLEDAREIINASAYSVSQGIGHLVHVTIRWGMMPKFNLRDWMMHQRVLFDAMRKWLVRHDVPVAFLWSREIGHKLGEHTHLLIHLPVKRWGDFKKFMLETGEFDPPNETGEAIKLRGNEYGTKTPYQRAGHMAYLLKTLDPNATCRAPAADGGTRRLMEALGVDDRGKPSLPVTGKRCGSSLSLNRAARQVAGWRELQTVAELRRYLHP